MSSQWYLYKDGQQQGPFDWEELSRQAEAGVITSNDMIWTEGMLDWTEAKKIKGLLADVPSPPDLQPEAAPPPPFNEHQAGGPPGYQAAPTRKKGKGGLIALVIVLALVLLGGGFFAVSYLFLDTAGEVISDIEETVTDISDEILPEEDDRDPEMVGQFSADTSDLWVPPASLSEEFLEMAQEDEYVDLNRMEEDYYLLVASLPKKGEIPYPPYPGALAYMVQESQELDNGVTLPIVGLLSYDPMENVVSFYQEQLQGWYHHEGDGISVFWEGDETDEVEVFGFLTPSVVIYDQPGMFSEIFMPEAESEIQIIYDPN